MPIDAYSLYGIEAVKGMKLVVLLFFFLHLILKPESANAISDYPPTASNFCGNHK